MASLGDGKVSCENLVTEAGQLVKHMDLTDHAFKAGQLVKHMDLTDHAFKAGQLVKHTDLTDSTFKAVSIFWTKWSQLFRDRRRLRLVSKVIVSIVAPRHNLHQDTHFTNI